MLFHKGTRRIACLAVVACVPLLVQSSLAQQTATGTPAAAQRGRGGRQPDSRVQQRTYHFADTDVDLPYAVFVSSKVGKDRKAPLIVALHGLGGNPNTLMHDNLLEALGYIVFAPAGYNPRGWYGISWTITPPAGAARRTEPAAANDPPNLTELAEKDVMNLLAMARREFNVDERRTYLMGHSMGGAGTFYLARNTRRTGLPLPPSRLWRVVWNRICNRSCPS